MKKLLYILVLFMLFRVDVTPVLAQTLFSEDFEGDLSQWIGKGGGAHSGITVADPLRPGNQVVKFTAFGSGGDMFGPEVNVIPGQMLHLSFEYLGLPNLGGRTDDLGGFIGFAEDLPGNHRWLAGTILCCGAESDPLIDDGQWRTYTVTFDPFATFTPINSTIRLIIEDFGDSGGVAGDVFFDNIELAPMPMCGQPAADDCVDLGEPNDEQFHNLVGWGDYVPVTAPSGDQTLRDQILRGNNSVTLFTEQANVPTTLITEVGNGGGACDDSFEIYVNGQGPVYRHQNDMSVGHVILTHRIPIPAELLPTTDVVITYRNISFNDCGLAGVFNARLLTSLLPVNQPPSVDAGPDQINGNANTNIILPGLASDDGLPAPPLLATIWQVISGPGQVSFSNTGAPTTLASFDKLGTYVLRLFATDGEFTVYDDIVVNVADHYRVELKAWIPHVAAVDPLMIQPFEFPNAFVNLLHGDLQDCFLSATGGNLLLGTTKVIASGFWGDDHIFYGAIDNEDSPDYRTLSWVEFDFDGEMISNFEYGGAYGATTRSLVIIDKNGVQVRCDQTATEAISNARPSVLINNTSFKMQVFGANPLMPREGTQWPEAEILICGQLQTSKELKECQQWFRNAYFEPAIDGEFTATIDLEGKLTFNYTTDLFPSYGIAVKRNFSPIMSPVIYNASCVPTEGYDGALNVLVLLQTVNNPLRNTGTATELSADADCSFSTAVINALTKLLAKSIPNDIKKNTSAVTEPFSLLLASLLPREFGQGAINLQSVVGASNPPITGQGNSKVFLPLVVYQSD